ncbi:glycosyltransferase family 2 protein [Pontimonas sp.]|nr:glycosyltransferase family 2 protein [Pontimonas sp.]
MTSVPLRTTIAIKSFRREEVFDAVASAVNQIRPCVVLVVDDGSGHEFQKKLTSSIAKLRNVRTILLRSNFGIGYVDNLIIQSADTEFLGFLDSDDLLSPHFVERMEESLDRNPRADFSYCRFVGGPQWHVEGQGKFKEVLKQGHLSALGTLFGRADSFRRLPALPTREEIGAAANACDDDRLSFELARTAIFVHVPEELYEYQDGASDRLTGDSEALGHSWRKLYLDYVADYADASVTFYLGRHLARIQVAFFPRKKQLAFIESFISESRLQSGRFELFAGYYWALAVHAINRIFSTIGRHNQILVMRLSKVLRLKIDWPAKGS